MNMNELDEHYFGAYFLIEDRKGQLHSDELKIIEVCSEYVTSRFSGMKYILGLAIDFILLAQQVRQSDPNLSSFSSELTNDELFENYPLVTSRGSRQANTLTVTVSGKQLGIRRLEEHVRSYFYAQKKLGYPSAYVYNTGQWTKYVDLLTNIFRLSALGRFGLLKSLLHYGNQQIATISISVLRSEVNGVFENVLVNYRRSSPQNENGGLAYQALVFGFVSEMYDHLSIIASKVRTGSAREKRIGDIDGYLGDRLVATFEIKDISLHANNYLREIGDFVNNVNSTGVLGVIVCKAYTTDLLELFSDSTVRIVSESELVSIVRVWDSVKQCRAIDGAFHFLANIEHNEFAVQRLKNFITSTHQEISEKSSD